MNKLTRNAGLLLAIALAGCSGSDGEESGTTEDRPASQTLRGANGGLTGFVWTERDGGVLDLDTGTTTFVGFGYGARPRADGKQFVSVRKNVRFTNVPSCGSEMSYFDRITVYDTYSGLALAGFDVKESLDEVPLLAPDGQTLAGHWRGAGCYSIENALTVWTRDGQQIIRGKPSIGAFDWLPDGRLVFEIDGDIVVETERNTLDYETVVELGNVPGNPDAFDVSPDGRSLVFEMVTDYPDLFETFDYREAVVWRVNLDGTGLQRAVDGGRPYRPGIGQHVNAPMFSPAGDALVVTENWIAGGSVALYGFDGPDFPIITGVDYAPVENGAVTQLVPLQDLPAVLPASNWTVDGIHPVFERGDDGALEPARLWPLEGRSWTPAVEPAATVVGSLPAANGRVNRGLVGSLYRRRSTDGTKTAIERLDLATGEVMDVPVPAEVNLANFVNFTVSDDGSRFALKTNDLFDNRMYVFDDSGTLIDSFELAEGTDHQTPADAPRFAPGSNNLIAWVFDDGDFGQGAEVLDINARRFETVSGEHYIDNLDWFPNGDLLLVDGAELLRVSRTSTGFAPPELLASLPNRANHARVHPDGNSVVYGSDRQLMLFDLTDGTERRLTAWAGLSEARPEFSPDGRFIVFKKVGQTRFGWPWIIATDAENVRLGVASETPGAMRVGESSELDWRVSDSDVLWR